MGGTLLFLGGGGAFFLCWFACEERRLFTRAARGLKQHARHNLLFHLTAALSSGAVFLSVILPLPPQEGLPPPLPIPSFPPGAFLPELTQTTLLMNVLFLCPSMTDTS